jgi:hypothetical protein
MSKVGKWRHRDPQPVLLNVCFQAAAKLTSTADMLKGFGCRQAYESLSCRNPRAAGGELWGFVFRGVPAPVANVRAWCCQDVEEVAFRPGRGACRDEDGVVWVPGDWRHSEAHMRFR